MKLLRPLALLLCFSSGAFAQTHRKIELPGLSTETLAKVYAKNPALKNGNWTQEDLDDLIQILVRDEQYDSVNILRESDNTYRLAIGKIRRIGSLTFQGNTAISEADLRRETGLAEKMPFDPNLLVQAGESIRSHYETLGFPKAQVDLKYNDSASNDVGIDVIVREGPRTMIDQFKIQTANPDLEKFLLKVLKKYRNEPLTEKTLVEMRATAREKLSAAGYWRADLPDPQVTRNFEESKATLGFKIDKPEQYTFETDGARQMSRFHMIELLQLEKYYSANPNVAGEFASKVHHLYLSQGYARAEVEGEERDGVRPFTKVIRLKITEGPRIRIRKMDFSGSFSQSEKVYADFLKEHSSETVNDGFYVKDDIDVGLKNLVTNLWNQGYLRAKVISTRTIYDKEREYISLLVNLDEGPLTQVQRVTFEGNKSIPDADLLKVVALEPGKPLRLFALDEAVLAVKQYYQNRGFLEMSLLDEKESLVTYNEDNTLVHLNFKIQEGPQVKVASILIEGNNLTRDYVIMKELEFKKGDILTPQKIDESISRLQRLGYFSLVEIKTLEEKTQIADRTVVVKVSDRDPGLFNFGAGVTNERRLTLRGYTGIAYRNLWGTGRGVSARLEGNYNIADIKFPEYKITLGYLEPYLFDSRTRGRINLVENVAVNNLDTTLASEVKQITYSLEQDITSHVLAIWDVWSLATVRDFYISGPFQDKEKDAIEITDTAITLDLDYRDHPFNPSSGTFTRFNTEYAAPWLGGTDTIEYTRSFASFTYYQSINHVPNLVWANSIRGGYLKNLSTKSDGAIPYDKKGFLVGGQSTIRGFTPDEAFPNSYDFNSSTDFSLKGTATMELFKSELRFPIWNNIGGALFYDGGRVQIGGPILAGQDFDESWRESIGIAARYMTPVGPVSLEYAWKLRPRGDRHENPSMFSFSIGTF